MKFERHPLAGPVVRIGDASGQAVAALKGGQVVSWRHAGREMLWMAATRCEHRPLRGGIPICWPWFGAHPDDKTQPSHGYARVKTFELIEQAADRVLLRLDSDQLSATVTVEVREGLHLALATRNNARDDVTVGAALHTYFAVSDVETVTVLGLDGAAYLDQLDGELKVQDGPVKFTSEVDRIYDTDAVVCLIDGSRRITIDNHQTSKSFVVWNPWIDKSARLGDMASNDFRRLVCIETAWAAGDVRSLASGAAQALRASYRSCNTDPAS